ncbi:MAG: ROK family protein [Acidimicrobiales bacterium]
MIDRVRMAAGEDGTVEGLGSGTAMARAAVAAGIEATGAELAALVADGNPGAVQVWNDAVEAVAVGVVNLCWLVTPQMVVVGGGVGMNSDLVLPIIRQRVAEFGPSIEPVEIVPAKLGDDAALSGAAAWWKAIGRDA